MIKRLNQTAESMNYIEGNATAINTTVVKYNTVFSNIINYTHDSNCFKKDKDFIDTKGVESLSYYFNFRFPIKPRVFVSLAGISAKKSQADTDNVVFQDILNNDIFVDHFTLSTSLNRRFYNYSMIQICYYATVNLLEYIPAN